jgi:hypothetical protein
MPDVRAESDRLSQFFAIQSCTIGVFHPLILLSRLLAFLFGPVGPEIDMKLLVRHASKVSAIFERGLPLL